MKPKTFMLVAGIIFSLISLLQLIRALMGWPAQIANFQVPLWLSWALFLVAGYMAYNAFSLSSKSSSKR